MMKKWHSKLLILLLLAGMAAGGWGLYRAAAQEPPVNLLKNGSLESPYYGQGSQTRTVPHDWGLWIGAGEPNALPHNDPLQVLDGAVAWSIKQSGAVFTAAGYQQVTVTPGDMLRATAYGWVFTCNDAIKACAIADPPYHRSDPLAGASMRVGIDPAGGLDPLATGVQWSAALAPYDQWAAMSVTATAQSSAVTVFLYMTQTQGLALNEAFWDKASLVVVTGETAATETGGDEVPYVVPQGVRPDGSIVHIVQTGDTLSSIAYAYFDYDVTLDSIAALNGLKPNTRFLQPGQELMILPPGSVDPVTGQLITPGAPVTSPTLPPDITPTATAQITREPLPGGDTLKPPTETPTETTTSTETTTPTETPAPTETPTPEPTITPRPEPTLTATPEPTATSQEIAALATPDGTLCVSVYEDTNLNGARDPGEMPLVGGQIVVSGGQGDVTYEYDGSADPLCIDQPAGQYRVSTVAPEGYGLTTVDSVVVGLVSGRTVDVAFGGAAGYTPVPTPESSESAALVGGELVPPGAVAPVIQEQTPKVKKKTTTLDRLYDRSGLFVLAAAGLIAIGSAFALAALRRPRL
jgi:LysM repeat protein